ncbi:MAG: hypothetical protein ACM4D3_05155 [Candidatus Sericytochromatia bacterium]
MKRQQRTLKVGAPAFGAGVLIAMGAITAATSGDAVTTSEPPTGPTDSASSSTSTTPPSTPETTKASPSVTASTSEGSWPETSTVKAPS